MFLPYAVEADEHEVQEKPWLVYGLLLAMLIVHLFIWLHLSDNSRLYTLLRYGVTKYDYHSWQPLTCTLLHGSWMHLVGNMYMLWVYGVSLERLTGWWQLLLVYIVGAYVSVQVQLWTMNSLMADVPVIGASGAISAVLGAFFVWLPHAWLHCLFFSPLTFRPLRLRLPAWVILILWFLAQLIHSLQLAGEVAGVAFWAHVAGFAAGAGLATFFKAMRQRLIEDWAEGRKTPLLDAWRLWLDGRREQALAAEEALRKETVTGAHGSQALLSGLVDLRQRRHREAAAAALTRAFRQAADYRDDARKLTCYLHLLQAAPPFEIAPDIHREAGLSALAFKRPAMALTCFQRAIITGEEERLGQVIASVAAMLEHKFARPDLARQVRELEGEVSRGGDTLAGDSP